MLGCCAFRLSFDLMVSVTNLKHVPDWQGPQLPETLLGPVFIKGFPSNKLGHAETSPGYQKQKLRLLSFNTIGPGI